MRRTAPFFLSGTTSATNTPTLWAKKGSPAFGTRNVGIDATSGSLMAQAHRRLMLDRNGKGAEGKGPDRKSVV